MGMDRLRLTCCEVDLRSLKAHRDDGTTVALSAREAEVLRWLAAHSGEVVSRDTLYTEVWGYAESVVSRAVDATLRRLRHKIERDPSDPDHVVTVHGEGYRFEPPRPRAPAPPRRVNSGATGEYVAAIELVRGTSQSAAWAEAGHAALVQVGGTLVSWEGDELLAWFGAPARAAGWVLEQVSSGEALGARGAVVRGDPAAVRRILAAIEAGSVALDDATHAEVHTATQTRDRVWRATEPVQLHPESPPAVLWVTGGEPPALAPALGDSPNPTTSMVGRDTSLTEIEGLLAGHRVVTITGTGGVGKTHLALEVASRRQAAGQAAWFLDGTALRSADDLVAGVARMLHVPVGPVAQVGYALRARPDDLVVLDNLEHIVVDARAVLDVWGRGPGARLLVTSREPVGSAGERVVELPPLEVDDGVALFLARAHGRFAPSDVQDLVVALDGLPLALELAAARTELLEPADLLVRIQRTLGAVGHDPARGARHADLQQVVAWSWSLLEPATQGALALLSAVFAGSFTVDDAEAVLGQDASLDHLHHLRRKGLLHRKDGRLVPYAAVRGFAAALVDEAELAAARDRHARWFARRGEQVTSEQIVSPERSGWLVRLGPELPELVAAFAHTCERDPRDAALAYLGAAAVWRAQGPRAPLHTLGARLLSHLDRLESALAARVLTQRITVGASRADLDEVEAALSGVDDPGVPVLRAELALLRNDAAQAERWLAQRVGEVGEVERLRMALQRAEIAELRGQWAIAEEHLGVALALATHRRATDVIADIFRRLSVAVRRQGHLQKALRLGMQCLAAADAVDVPAPRAYALGNVMVMRQLNGESHAAREAGEACLEAMRALGERLGVQVTLANLAEVYATSFDVALARQCLDEALELAHALGQAPTDYAYIRLARARVILAQGEPAGALQDLDAALTVGARPLPD